MATNKKQKPIEFGRAITLGLWFCIICAWTTVKSTWDDLADTAVISWTSANLGVTAGKFSSKTFPPDGSKLLTKTEALANYMIDPNNDYIKNKAGNQLVVKRDFSIAPVPYTVEYNYSDGSFGHGWQTSQQACNEHNPAASVQAMLTQNILPSSLVLGPSGGYPQIADDGLWYVINDLPVKIEYKNIPSVGFRYVIATVGGACSQSVTIAPQVNFLYYAGGYMFYEVYFVASDFVNANVTVDYTISYNAYPMSIEGPQYISPGTNSSRDNVRYLAVPLGEFPVVTILLLTPKFSGGQRYVIQP